MKKAIFLALMMLVLPLSAHAQVFGFLDGNFYDTNGNFKYICFLDNTCLGADNQQYLKSDILKSDSPKPYIVPVVMPDLPTPLAINTPTVSSPETPVPTPTPIPASCTLIGIPTSSSPRTLTLSWTSQNLSKTTGRLYFAVGQSGGQPIFKQDNNSVVVNSGSGLFEGVSGTAIYYKLVFDDGTLCGLTFNNW